MTSSKKAAIGRIGLIFVLAIIMVIAALGVYAYTDTSLMTAKTITPTTSSTSYYATTYTTPFIITNITKSNSTNTENLLSNSIMTTSPTPSSETNSVTNSSATLVESAEECIPTTGYISTLTLTQQNTTSTEQLVYDGTSCNFGDANVAPSAILIPADTLVWTNFQLLGNGSYEVIANFDFLPVPEAMTANITVATYLNGNLNVTTPYSMSDYDTSPELTNASQMPPSNSSSNSIFALPGVVLTLGISGQANSVYLNGTTITVALVSDKPLWLCGWTPEEMSKGTGSRFGQSLGQLNGTYEWSDPGLTLPNSLPRPTTILSFELRVSGDYY